jgi:hypothetical protein
MSSGSFRRALDVAEAVGGRTGSHCGFGSQPDVTVRNNKIKKTCPPGSDYVHKKKTCPPDSWGDDYTVADHFLRFPSCSSSSGNAFRFILDVSDSVGDTDGLSPGSTADRERDRVSTR